MRTTKAKWRVATGADIGKIGRGSDKRSSWAQGKLIEVLSDKQYPFVVQFGSGSNEVTIAMRYFEVFDISKLKQ